MAKREPLKISIKEAIKFSKKVGWLVHWRPAPNLPEEEQYCIAVDD
jgi:hypothetical protein